MIEGSISNADSGVAVALETAQALGVITDSAQKVDELVAEIAAASGEQAQGVEQVTSAVGQMDAVTQSNAANAEESASAAEELSAQAGQLDDMVRQLQTLVGGGGSTREPRPDPAAGRADGALDPPIHAPRGQGIRAGKLRAGADSASRKPAEEGNGKPLARHPNAAPPDDRLQRF